MRMISMSPALFRLPVKLTEQGTIKLTFDLTCLLFGILFLKDCFFKNLQMLRFFLTLCMLGNFSYFCYRMMSFLKINIFKKYFKNTIRVSNGLDPDQDLHFV